MTNYQESCGITMTETISSSTTTPEASVRQTNHGFKPFCKKCLYKRMNLFSFAHGIILVVDQLLCNRKE